MARLVVATLLATAVSTLLDFSFKEVVAAQLPAARLPAFFARFHLATNAASLLLQLCGVAFVVRAAGVARAPLVHPLLLVPGLVGALLTGGLAAVVLLRGFDTALRSALHRPALELLQIPLPAPVGRRAKALIDGVGLRGGQALAAGALLVMLHLAVGPSARLLLAAALLGAWTLVVLGLGRRYVDLLRRAALRPDTGRSAAGSSARPELSVWGTSISLVSAPPPRGADFEAIAAALADAGQPAAVRSDAPRALVDLDPDRAAAVLLDALLVERDGFVRLRILRALDRVRRVRPALVLDEDILGRAAVAAVEAAYRYLAWRLFLEDGAARQPGRRTAAWEMLQDLLRGKEQSAIERLFRVLALRYPREDFHELLRTLRAGGRRTRAVGRELIDNLLAGPAHTLTLALVDDASDRQRLAAMTGVRPLRAPTYRRLLQMMRADDDAGELAALAEQHAGELDAAPAPDRTASTRIG